MRVGGEFEIDPNSLKEVTNKINEQNFIFYASGRIALLAILKFHGLKERVNIIHLPFYICDSVVDICIKAGYYTKFYELNENFQFCIEYLENIKERELLLTVNYFGLVDDNNIISEIKKHKPEIVIICDQVQSFWTFDKTEADYSFTSLRKHFAVPDGAFVYAKSISIIMQNELQENFFYKNKLIGSLLKYYKGDDDVYLHFFLKGESELNELKDISKASEISSHLYYNLNFEQIRSRRQENYNLVQNFCEDNNIQILLPYNKDAVPMNVPILVDNRDKIRRTLYKSNIYLPVHWPIFSHNKDSKFCRKMADKELSLVMDQRYSLPEIMYELNLLKSLMYG